MFKGIDWYLIGVVLGITIAAIVVVFSVAYIATKGITVTVKQEICNGIIKQ